MGTIETELIELIQQQSDKLKNDPIIKELEKANLEFKALLEQGLVKERGYNLQTVENAHLTTLSFNTHR